MKKILRYLNIWWIMSRNSFSIFLSLKLSFSIFLTGKILRFIFFISFLFFILQGTKTLAGYTSNQAIFFFLTFNLVDVMAQFLFREVYRFRSLIVSGSFDLVLVKPVNALFRVLMGGADVLDFITIPPIIFAVYYVGRLLSPTTSHTVLFLLLIINSLVIATAFHIAVLALGIITLEVDHTIMIYRDITNLGRFPVDIYRQPLQGVLTYLIPVGVMVTFPAKALIGLLSPSGILLSFGLGLVAVFASIRFWNFALTKYTSASS